MDLGLSQRKLAKLLGVDKKSVENWEGRGIAPARWVAPKLNEFLGLQHPVRTGSFGERLTAYRRKLGLSQEALARMLRVHKTTVVRWETERRHPLRSLQGRIDVLIELDGASTPRDPGEDENG